MATKRKRTQRTIRTLTIIFACAFVIANLAFFGAQIRRNQIVAEPAIEAARRSTAIAAALGQPITAGWLIRGRTISKNGNGNADLEIPIQGSQRKGTLIEWAQESDSQWHLCSLVFHPETGSVVVLLDSATTHCEPE